MPKVVVAGGTLSCPHQGVVTLASGASALQISGGAVITAGMEGSLPFTGCTYVTGGAPTPCLSTPATSGTATKLTVGGAPALLDSATGNTSNGVPWTVQAAGQSKMEP